MGQLLCVWDEHTGLVLSPGAAQPAAAQAFPACSPLPHMCGRSGDPSRRPCRADRAIREHWQPWGREEVLEANLVCCVLVPAGGNSALQPRFLAAKGCTAPARCSLLRYCSSLSFVDHAAPSCRCMKPCSKPGAQICSLSLKADISLPKQGAAGWVVACAWISVLGL